MSMHYYPQRKPKKTHIYLFIKSWKKRRGQVRNEVGYIGKIRPDMKKSVRSGPYIGRRREVEDR
jgi:hypothetical protein